MTEKEIQPIAIDGKIIDFKTKEVIEDLDKGINTFKVIETIKHDDKRIYELTKNDIGYYNFKGEKLLAHLICNELNRLLEENDQLKADNNRLVNETARIVAEHQRRILDLIDDKVDELEKRYKFGQEVYHGCPMHNIRFGINVLKELKKELQE